MFLSRLTTTPGWRLNEIQQEMNRLFDRWGNNSAGVLDSPVINLWEKDDALYLEAEMPGLALEDMEIFVTGHNQLTLKGERKPTIVEKGTQHRQERSYGKFTRTFALPFAVDENKVEAHFENGVLKLHLPKHEEAMPRKISIRA